MEIYSDAVRHTVVTRERYGFCLVPRITMEGIVRLKISRSLFYGDNSPDIFIDMSNVEAIELIRHLNDELGKVK